MLASDGTLPPSTLIDARPVALVDGRSVFWSDLKPILGELAGGEALREIVLDRMLQRELQRQGLAVSPDDVARERKLLVQTLHEDIDVATRLLDDLRRRRRLGPVRFQRLMERNAAMRNLVQDQVQITDATLRQTFDILYGERRQVRLITTATLADAETVRTKIEGGEPFGEVAAELSTDTSASRGGLLSPMSGADSGYPEALRQAAWRLEPGDVSRPILLDDQYAVVQLVRVIDPQDVPIEEVREEVERVARLNQERLAMERLARQLLGNVTITFFDEAVERGYRAVRREGSSPLQP